MMELLEIIGPIKIKDALFIGDEVAAQVSHTVRRLGPGFRND